MDENLIEGHNEEGSIEYHRSTSSFHLQELVTWCLEND